MICAKKVSKLSALMVAVLWIRKIWGYLKAVARKKIFMRNGDEITFFDSSRFVDLDLDPGGQKLPTKKEKSEDMYGTVAIVVNCRMFSLRAGGFSCS